MLKKLKQDSLQAEASSLESLAAKARRVGDIVAARQLSKRLDRVRHELTDLGVEGATSASVGIFFSGAPVLGSKGIKSEFAGHALENFQDLVSKHFATMERGDLGERGPVPVRPATDLMVTDVVRGSFGFVLEEADEQQQAIRTALADALQGVTVLVTNLASPQIEVFDEAAAEASPRVLAAARKFFKTLADAGAAVRIVEGDRDQQFSVETLRRARDRAEETEVTERDDVELTGRLAGLTPHGRRFDFEPRGDANQVISGTIAREVAQAFIDQLNLPGFDDPIGKTWRARFRVREVTHRNGNSRRFYTLLGLLEQLANPA